MKKGIFKKLFIFTMPFLFVFGLASCSSEEEKPSEVKEEIKEYIVSFDTDGDIKSSTVLENGLVEEPLAPTKNKYTFLGWYLGDTKFDFNTKITSDITLHAKWRSNSAITLNRLGSSETYDVETEFKASYFINPSNVFSKDLARFAFNLAAINYGDERVSKFFNALDFDNIFMIKENDSAYDGVSYSFAHKKIDDTDYIAVSIRGMRYYEEWAGNFDIGGSGNHKDFEKCANIVYSSLKDYYNRYNYSSNAKVIMSGYSRSAAISNVLADKIMKDTTKLVENDNLYVYTYEAPNCLDINNVIAYPNVFNFINSGDMVVNLPPTLFGFGRCGIDIDIYNPNMSSIVKEFDDSYIIPEFKKLIGNDVSNDQELPIKFIENLTDYNANPNSETYQEDLTYEIDTREKYFNNLSPTIQYLFNFAFDTKTETLDKMIAGIINIFKTDTTRGISLFTNGDNLHDFVASYLNRDNIRYDDQKLYDASNKIVGTLSRNASIMLFAYANSSNLTRMGLMHSPLVAYILMSYYLNNN
ncbi:MAG: InlB B-repeat-containing protein [Acholeplasmatales bacterium]|nr:InlB B-repeat-containing protein [Acholeplasmatales bacterium]